MLEVNAVINSSRQRVGPEVSLIIPCYNYGRFLRETIGSLQKQSYQDWEAIIVDDGSVDDTANCAAVLAQGDDRLIYIHQSNQGVSAARNKGISLARGEFVLFLDADDLLTATKLQSHVEHLRSCPSVDISYSKFRYFPDGRPEELFTNYGLDSQQEWSRPVSGCGRVTFPVFIRKNNLPLQAAVFRRSLLQRVGLFEQSMRALEDWDYLLRCILRGACMGGLEDQGAMTLMRVHPSSATRNIAFSDYIDRVYKNVLLEVENLRTSDREGEANFYAGLFQKTLSERARRKRKRLFREKKIDVRDRILSSGLANIGELSEIAREFGRLNCFRAYVSALVKYFSAWQLF